MKQTEDKINLIATSRFWSPKLHKPIRRPTRVGLTLVTLTSYPNNITITMTIKSNYCIIRFLLISNTLSNLILSSFTILYILLKNVFVKATYQTFFSEKSNNKWKIQISCGLSVKLPLA